MNMVTALLLVAAGALLMVSVLGAVMSWNRKLWVAFSFFTLAGIWNALMVIGSMQ